MKGLSGVRELLAVRFITVGIVMLFVLSGTAGILERATEGDVGMAEGVTGEGTERVTERGGVKEEEGAHGGGTGGRDGSNKGEDVIHYEEDEFGGSWFDDFEDGSGIEGGLKVGRLEADEHTVGLWHFDEGSGNKAKDASGNGNNGTLMNMEEEDWVNGKYGRGLEFDGQNEYVDIGDISSVNFGNGDFAISGWIFPKSTGRQMIVAKDHQSNRQFNLAHDLSDDGTLKLLINYFKSNTDRVRLVSDANAVTLHSWNFVVAQRVGNNFEIYVNGVLIKSGTSYGTHGIMQDSIASLQIGRREYAGYNEEFNGIIDEVRISNIARTSEEIRRNYEGGLVLRNGKVEFARNEFDPGAGCVGYWSFDEGRGKIATDYSNKGNHGTLKPDTEKSRVNWTINGRYGNSLRLDGVDDYVEVSHSDDLNIGGNGKGFTAEAWIKQLGPAPAAAQIIRKGTGGARYEFVIDNSGTRLHLICYNGGNNQFVDASINPGDGNWHHVAFTKSASDNLLRTFFDGVLKGTSASACSGTEGSTDPLWLGCEFGNAKLFGGNIDEFIIYNHELTLDEIQQHYNRATFTIYPNSNNLTSTPITRPTNMIWDTLSISKTEPSDTYIKVSVINNASNQTIEGFDNLTSRNIDLTPLNDLNIPSIRLKAHFSGNGSATPSMDSWGVEWIAENTWRDSFTGNSKVEYPYGVDEHTVGYWRFEEGSGNVARDSSGNGNDGALHNIDDDNWMDGRFGGGLKFDGVDDYVACGDKSKFEFSADFTVEAWVKHSATCNQMYVSKWTGSGTGPGWYFGYRGSSSQVIFGVYTASSSSWLTGENIADGNWHHVVGIRIGTKLVIYQDGNYVNQLTGDMDISGQNIASLTIGNYYSNSGHWKLNGIIDEVRISNTSRTPEEIRQAYQAGIAIRGGQAQLSSGGYGPGADPSCVGYWSFDEGDGETAYDGSGNGNDGTLKNMEAGDWVDGVKGGALEFDGQDDYVDCGNDISVQLEDNLTVEAWVKMDVLNSGKTFGFFSKVKGDVNGWALVKKGSGNTFAFLLMSGSSYEYISSNIPYDDTNWHHLVGVRKNGIASLYVDGVLQDETSVHPVTDSGESLMIGRFYSNSLNYLTKGTIDEVRISNIARTPEEIARNYNLGKAIRGGHAQLPEIGYNPGSDPSCVGYWSFDEGSGDTAHDGSGNGNGNGNDGTLKNMEAGDWVDGVKGGALEFEGVDDYVDMGDKNELTGTGYTFEFWVKTNDVSGHEVIIDKFDEATHKGIQILKLGTQLQVYPDTSGTNCIDTSFFTVNTWYNGAIIVDNSGCFIYRNGVLRDTGTYNTITDNNENFYIGQQDGFNRFFNGIIDEIAIYNRALTPAEISAHYNFTYARYTTNATLRSVSITVPANHTWSTFHFNRTVPNGTFLNISVHDNTTNKTLTTNLTNNSTGEYIDLTGINAFEHPTIYLNASFESNGTVTPVLFDWAVNWTPIVEPELVLPIDDIPVTEDTPQAGILNVSHYFSDRYAGIHPPSYSIEYDDTNITLELNGTILNIIKLADNYTGNTVVQVLCTNVYDRTTASNAFNISVIGENDAPVWFSAPPLVVLNEDTIVTTEWSLADYIHDAEGDDIEYIVISGDAHVSGEVLDDGKIKISAVDDYFGNTFLNVCAQEVHNRSIKTKNVSIPVTVNPINDPPLVELVSPAEGSILPDTTVTFTWKAFDVDNDIADLRFKLNLGTAGEPEVHTSDIAGNKITISGLIEGETYYWWIIPNDIDGKGICLNDTWSFSIGSNASVPTVVLNSPLNGSIINNTEVNLTWNIRNLVEGMPIYLVYLGIEKDNLSEVARSLDNWYPITDLEDNTTYYWKVIPVVGALVGRCSDGIWSFAVDTTFEVIHNISVELDVERLDIIHGENAVFNLTVTNNGNVPTMIELSGSGVISGILEMPKKIILQIRESQKILIKINKTTSIFPDVYELTLDISYPGGIKTLIIPINITSGEPVDNEVETKKETSGQNWLFLILGIVLLFIILAIAVFLILKKRRSSEDKEVEDVIDVDIVKPGESPFSQTQQVSPPRVEQATPQFAPRVKHDYTRRTDRVVPATFTTPPQPAKEEIRSIGEILKRIETDVPQSPPLQGTPVPSSEQLPLRTDAAPPAPVPQPIPSGPQIVGIDTQFAISDMFLIYVDGRLVKSVSLETKLSEGMDEDIMSGMLTAITDFIKDSFSEESGSLKSLQYGKMTIYIERGVGMYLAVVFRGQPPYDLREKIRWLLIRLWERYKKRLKVWDGSCDGLDGLDSMLNSLLNQTEPQEDESSRQPAAIPDDGTVPTVSTATEAVMCNICMGVVKPGLEVITCPCGNRYHKVCGDRVAVCPKCGISLQSAVQPTLQAEITVEDPPLPSGLMPPPPDAPLNSEIKALPEFSGQKAGERNEFKI